MKSEGTEILEIILFRFSLRSIAELFDPWIEYLNWGGGTC